MLTYTQKVKDNKATDTSQTKYGKTRRNKRHRRQKYIREKCQDQEVTLEKNPMQLTAKWKKKNFQNTEKSENSM